MLSLRCTGNESGRIKGGHMPGIICRVRNKKGSLLRMSTPWEAGANVGPKLSEQPYPASGRTRILRTAPFWAPYARKERVEFLLYKPTAVLHFRGVWRGGILQVWVFERCNPWRDFTEGKWHALPGRLWSEIYKSNCRAGFQSQFDSTHESQRCQRMRVWGRRLRRYSWCIKSWAKQIYN